MYQTMEQYKEMKKLYPMDFPDLIFAVSDMKEGF